MVYEDRFLWLFFYKLRFLVGRVIKGFDKGLLDLGLYELTSRVI
jgi:hypothetical protein